MFSRCRKFKEQNTGLSHADLFFQIVSDHSTRIFVDDLKGRVKFFVER